MTEKNQYSITYQNYDLVAVWSSNQWNTTFAVPAIDLASFLNDTSNLYFVWTGACGAGASWQAIQNINFCLFPTPAPTPIPSGPTPSPTPPTPRPTYTFHPTPPSTPTLHPYTATFPPTTPAPTTKAQSPTPQPTTAPVANVAVTSSGFQILNNIPVLVGIIAGAVSNNICA